MSGELDCGSRRLRGRGANDALRLRPQSVSLSYINGVPGVSHSHERSFHQWLATLNALAVPVSWAGGGRPEREAGNCGRLQSACAAYSGVGLLGRPAMPRDATTALDGRYTDNDSWSTNEVDIDWQASALYNLHFAQWLAHGGQPRTLARR